MKKLYTLLFVLAGLTRFYAQSAAPLDTVYLLSGKTVTGIVKDSTDDELKILIPKKNGDFKADFVDMDLVFSVKYRNGQESVLYKQDTLFGNYFTPQEIRYYMYGERDARANFHCPLWIAGAFAAGFGGGYFRSALSPVPAFAYSGLTTAFRVKIRPGSVSNPDNIKYDTYILGYEKEARKRRLFQSLIWSGIGMVAGIAVASALPQSN